MTDKGFNLFDECAARCVHLFPLEEECTSSSWGDSKMYTSTINCIIFWDFLMFYQILLSPQVKQRAIITYKHGIYSCLTSAKRLKT